MSKSSHFLYRHKVIIFNLLLTAFIVGVDPRYLLELPDTGDFNYYIGVGILLALFFEFAGIWYKSRFIFSFPVNLHKPVPWYIGMAFLPRIVTSAALAMLALKAMGALEVSDFFLLPIIAYATIKEFWVRATLLNTKRDKTVRTPKGKVWLGEIMLFLFICVGYMSVWEVYLLENPRIMYMVLTPINWGLVGPAFLILLLSLEMPFYWEEHLRTKPRREKIFALLSALLPMIGVLVQLYMIGYVLR